MIAIGTLPCRQPDSFVYSKTGNPQFVHEWKGQAGLMAGLIQNLRVAYDEVSVDTREGVTTVRGFSRRPIGTVQEPPIINYDLVSEQQTLDLALSPYFSDLSNAQITAVMNAFNDSKKTREEKESDIEAIAGNSTLAKELLSMKERGQDSYIDYSWTFTRTTNVSRYYPTSIDFSNHGKVWSNTAVNNYVGAANIPLFTLPSKSSDSDQVNSGKLDYGWLRFQSQVQLSSTGNFNVIEGWRYALWNTAIYTSYTG